MTTLHQLLRHPAGWIGLTVGLTLGFIAATTGKTRNGVILVGLYRLCTRHLTRH
jgi:hypothetical protein